MEEKSGSFKDLKDVFQISKTFPKEELYSLTNQIRRSSRSVCQNIAEAYRKRNYPRHFAVKITNADGEASETIVCLDFSKDCNYITDENYQSLTTRYVEVGKMLGSMVNHPENFLPKD